MRRLTRLIAICLAGACATAACAGEQEIFAEGEGGSELVAAQDMQLPDPLPAVPAFVVDGDGPLRKVALARLRATPGAAAVAPVAIKEVAARGARGVHEIRVASIDPLEFRPVAPSATRDADFVWLSLLTGDAIATHAAAETLGIRKKNEIRIKGHGTLRVSALADNGSPSFADVVVGHEELEPGSWGPPDLAVIGAETGVTFQALAEDLRSAVPGAEIRRVGRERRNVDPQPYIAAPELPAQAVSGLHPTLAAAIQRLIGASGGRVWIVSGFRTTAHQYELWINALKKYGDPEVANNWVAPPGHSMHEYGLAVDLGGDVEYAAALVEQLKLPLWRPMSWEPWHFELVGSR